MRKKIVAGNWKMNKTRDEALQFIYAVSQNTPSADEIESIVFAPSIFLRCLVKRRGNEMKIGAQNVHQQNNGAFTGEISPLMIKTTGVSHVLVGHSERRINFAETDELVNLKVIACLKSDITPMVCCGEEISDYESGKTLEVLDTQVTKILKNVKQSDIPNVVIAYEPVWAIGTGKTPKSTEVEEAVVHIRQLVSKLYNQETADKVRILYGGSVTTDNIKDFMTPNVDGFLCGAASLNSANFLNLVNICLEKE